MNAHAEKSSEVVPAVALTPPVASAVTPAAYNTLVASARLRDIKLVTSNFVLDPDGLSDQPSWKQLQTCEIEQSYYDEARKLLIAWVSANASCTKDDKVVVAAQCKYVVIYSVDGDPEEVAVTAFAKRVARFAVYPYFRAHFAGITSQAGLFLPPLPIIKEKKNIPAVLSSAGEGQIEHVSKESG